MFLVSFYSELIIFWYIVVYFNTMAMMFIQQSSKVKKWQKKWKLRPAEWPSSKNICITSQDLDSEVGQTKLGYLSNPFIWGGFQNALRVLQAEKRICKFWFSKSNSCPTDDSILLYLSAITPNIWKCSNMLSELRKNH